MEQSWEHVAHTTTLMEMRTDYKLPPSRIRVLEIETNNALQRSEEEWKMQEETLRQPEEAAGEQKGRFLRLNVALFHRRVFPSAFCVAIVFCW